MNKDIASCKDTAHWYALKTKSRHEKKVFNYLEKTGNIVFLPLVEVWSKRKDRKKKLHVPLFAGYIFVQCHMDTDKKYELLPVPGVASIVGKAGIPVPIPDEQIKSVQKVIFSGFVPKPHPYLDKGDKVIVKEGQLEGAVGLYIRSNNKSGKLIVSVDMLGRSVEVNIDAFMVDKF